MNPYDLSDRRDKYKYVVASALSVDNIRKKVLDLERDNKMLREQVAVLAKALNALLEKKDA